MLVLDGEAQARSAKGSSRERAREQRRLELLREIQSNTVTVEDDASRDRTNLLAQLGRPLTSQQVMDRLKLCNQQLVFERSIAYPNLIGIYVLTPTKQPTGSWKVEKRHFCGMEAGIMPEFTVVHKKTTRVANPDLLGNAKATRDVPWKEVDTYSDETRGWRTVLIRLLGAGLIKRHDVEKHFGWDPSYESKLWHRFTQGA